MSLVVFYPKFGITTVSKIFIPDFEMIGVWGLGFGVWGLDGRIRRHPLRVKFVRPANAHERFDLFIRITSHGRGGFHH